jgi:hypothetical protein
MYLGAESAVSSENPLKSLRIPADFDSTMRRFESSRRSQHLPNKIRHFWNRPNFHSDALPILEFSRPRQESEQLHHTAFVQKLKNFDLPDAESVEMMDTTCDGYGRRFRCLELSLHKEERSKSSGE